MAAGPEGVPGVSDRSEPLPEPPPEPPGPLPEPLPEPPGPAPVSPPEPLRLRRHRGRFLLWEARAARALRERHRLWGALLGAPPRRGRAGVAAGPRLPLELRAEEARALRESGGAVVVETVDEAEAEPEETPTDPSPTAERRFRVFRELWGRGLHLTPGGKFGGDFLVYPGPPSLFHACAVALCPGRSRPQPLGALLAGARLGTSVRKALLLCEPAPPGGALACTALTWRADLT